MLVLAQRLAAPTQRLLVLAQRLTGANFYDDVAQLKEMVYTVAASGADEKEQSKTRKPAWCDIDMFPCLTRYCHAPLRNGDV